MLLQWCENEHFEWDEKSKTAYGYYDTFPICVISQGKAYLLYAFCEAQSGEASPSIANFDGTRLSYTMPHEKSPSMMYIAAAVNHICKTARDAGLKPAKCMRCKSEEQLRVWPFSGEYSVYCINCREALSKQESANKQEEPMPNRQNLGGAVIGAFLAVIFYAVVYQLGSFAPLAGAAAGLFICAGYNKKGSAAFTTRAFSLCGLIGLISVLIAQTAALWLTLYMSYFWLGYNLWESFLLLPRFLGYQGVLRAAITDVITALVPMLLIMLWWHLRARRRAKRR